MHWPSNACPHAHACTPAAALVVCTVIILQFTPSQQHSALQQFCETVRLQPQRPLRPDLPPASMCHAAMPHLCRGVYMQHSLLQSGVTAPVVEAACLPRCAGGAATAAAGVQGAEQ